MGMDAEVYCKVDRDVNDALWRIAALCGMGLVDEERVARRPRKWEEWDDRLSVERDAVTKQQTWIEWNTLTRYFNLGYAKGYWPIIRSVLVAMMHVTGNAYYRSDSMSGPIGYYEHGYSAALTPERAITVELLAELDALWATTS